MSEASETPLTVGADYDTPHEFTVMATTFLVRHMTPGKRGDVRAALDLPRKGQPGESLTDDKADELTAANIDWMLAGWRNLTGPDGEELPVTFANKLAVTREHQVVADRLEQWSAMAWFKAQRVHADALGKLPLSSVGGAEAGETQPQIAAV